MLLYPEYQGTSTSVIVHKSTSVVSTRVEEGSLQGRLESEPVSSTDRDRGTRVRR